MTQRPWFHMLLTVLGAWMLVQMLLRFTGPIFTSLAVLTVGLATVTFYALRHERGRLAVVYDKPVCKQFVDLVCRASRQQPPVELAMSSPPGPAQLKTSEDFDWCADKLKECVFGHDAAIDRIVAQMKKNVLLRQRSETKSELPPLGVFFLAGPRGTGKRLLATQIGQQLFNKGAVSAFNMKDYSDGDSAVGRLLGAKGQEGDLLRAVKLRPYHTIVMENIESAAPAVHEALQALCMDGCCIDGATSSPVSVQNCVIFMTTTAVCEAFNSGEPVAAEKLIDAFCATTDCPAGLLGLANEALQLEMPDVTTKARVVLDLMVQECRKYRLTLDYVEPEIVAREVRQYCDSGGFESSKIRIARWISAPIHLAVEHGLENLVLTSDLIEGELAASAPRPAAERRYELAT